MVRIHFCSLGCGSFEQSAWRIANEARRLGIFETVTVYDHIPQTWQRGRDITTRGAGYWFWKPKLIREVLETKVAEGDLVIYCDAGCKLYPSDEWNRFLNHFREDRNLSCLAFELPDQVNRTWIKADLFAHFNLDLAGLEARNQHISATAMIWRKTVTTVQFLEKWQSLIDQTHLVDDSASILPNTPEFKEHRHDQAIFSLLLRTSSINKKLITDLNHPPREGLPIVIIRSKSGPSD